MQRDEELFPIGAVAARSGVAHSALRFYEERGLITSERTPGGQRLYHRDVLRRLAFIQAAQQVGLSLEEIADALAAVPEHAGPSGKEWREMAKAWRPLIDERLRLLTALRDRLDSCIGCGCLSLTHCQLANPGDRAGRAGPGARYLHSRRGPR